jgi:glutaredoxin
MTEAMAEVTVYTRPGCHLCEEAIAAIEEIRSQGVRFELRKIDIEGDDELHARYLERIPVVLVGGDQVSELILDEAALRARLDTVRA